MSFEEALDSVLLVGLMNIHGGQRNWFIGGSKTSHGVPISEEPLPVIFAKLAQSVTGSVIGTREAIVCVKRLRAIDLLPCDGLQQRIPKYQARGSRAFPTQVQHAQAGPVVGDLDEHGAATHPFCTSALDLK